MTIIHQSTNRYASTPTRGISLFCLEWLLPAAELLGTALTQFVRRRHELVLLRLLIEDNQLKRVIS